MLPSGDQEGSNIPSAVVATLRSEPPSALTVKTSNSSPSLLLEKAICALSGDHAGLVATALCSVTACCSDPSGRMSQSS